MSKSIYFQPEHDLFRQTCRDFFQTQIIPQFKSWEEMRTIPRAAWQQMGEMGYLGLIHDEQYGGSNTDLFYSVVFLEEVGRAANGGLGAAISVQEYMAVNHLAKAGSDALKEKYLRPAIAGTAIAALAITEPDAGSDVQGIRTTAQREGDFFIVNGSKTFITSGHSADFITTLVRTDAGHSLLIIDANSEGVSRTKLNKIGWHSSDTAEIAFDNVRVPASNLIGEDGMGFYYVMDSFQLERLVAAVLSVAAAEYCIEMTLQYMHERTAFGKPIAKYQALRHRIADLATEVKACQELVYHTAWLFEQGEFAVKECSMCKLKATELQKEVVDACLQMYGGFGYMEEYPIAQMYRDARVATIVGGTSEIMREIIAKMQFDSVGYKAAYK
jgi:acyl-CoA dehydrogenase